MENDFDWLISKQHNGVSLKIRPKFSYRDDQCKNQLLQLRVSSLYIMKDFTSVIYGLLNPPFFSNEDCTNCHWRNDEV